MKIRRISAIATALALAATIGVQSASAVDVGLRSKIPFEFHAAGKLFPAGTYILSKLNPTTLKLQAPDGKVVFISAGREATKMNDESWISFNRYGNQNFLAGAYWSGAGISLSVPADRAEKEVAKVASQHNKPVRIAAK